MKAKTIRPLLIILLFGFLPTTGWMIVGGGANRTVTRVLACRSPLPHGGAMHRAGTSQAWGASGTRAHEASWTDPHAQSVASAIPATAATPRTTDPKAATVPNPARSGTPAAGAPGVGTSDPAAYTADAGSEAAGFGDFGSPPGWLGGSGVPVSSLGAHTNPSTAPAGGRGTVGSRPAASGGSGSSGSGPTTSGSSGGSGSGQTTSGGSGGGNPGSGGTSTGVNLHQPPPGSTGTPTTQDPSGSGGGDPTVTAAEPATLALFLAGLACMGLALRRRLPG